MVTVECMAHFGILPPLDYTNQILARKKGLGFGLVLPWQPGVGLVLTLTLKHLVQACENLGCIIMKWAKYVDKELPIQMKTVSILYM